MARAKVVKSYQEEVVDRIFELVKVNQKIWPRFMGVAGEKDNAYPLFSLTVGNLYDDNINRVVISAGIHGEEPAGVYALLKFLEEDIMDFCGDYAFLIFPCINPFGFERGYRFNKEGLDINREFKAGTLCGEANAVMRALKRRGVRFECTVDLHETDPDWASEGCKPEDNPKEFYMWEVCPNKNLRVGNGVIKRLSSLVPVCVWDTIYQDINSGGVIWYPEGCVNSVYAQRTTLEGFLADHFTPQSFTLETPCGWNMKRRVFAHRIALRDILELKRQQKTSA